MNHGNKLTNKKIDGIIKGCRNKVQCNRVHGNKVHVFFIAGIRYKLEKSTF